MASVIAHAASASIIALSAAQVQPDETALVAAALITACIPDLDHLVYIIRDRAMYAKIGYRGNLHNARSLFHELPGLLMVGVLASLVFLASPRLAYVIFIAFTIHLVEDWLLGTSTPFNPVDHTLMRVFPLKYWHKVVIDILIVVVSGGLWILYLGAGQ
jgi:membrane-bound metal-dependent hydrolase YbcI (DUF457 family)